MKKITRIVCLVLCLVMLLPAAVACSQKDGTYGAQINMYLADEIHNLDPAYAHLDSGAAKLIGLLFEGLMVIDEDGDLEKGLLKKYQYTVDDMLTPNDKSDDTYTMVIDIGESSWSDGIKVSADDFVYAWKRVLDPSFDGEAASLLYDIKGAVEHKTQMASKDDIGLSADDDRITITFKHNIDPEEFLRKTASPALVPLRSSVVSRYYNWSSSGATMVCNGPFFVRSYSPGNSMQLARNAYYHRLPDEDIRPTKFVKPYLINIDFKLNGEDMMKAFEDGELFYISELPCDKKTREEYEDRVKLTDTLSTHTYFFNLNKEPFNNKTVRQVLSKVIDREALVSEVVYAYASTGFVPKGLSDLTKKDDFAENNTAKIPGNAQMSVSEAKAALSAAGINPNGFGELTITVKVDAVSDLVDEDYVVSQTEFDEDTVDYVVAKMVAEIWNELGFNFKVVPVNAIQYKESTSAMSQYRDELTESLYGIYDDIKVYVSDDEHTTVTKERATFDVVALDYSLLCDDEFNALAVFAESFSGSVTDGPFNEEVPLGHITGFKKAAYNTLIQEAYDARVAGNNALASEKLHAAEQLLLDEMPVVPLFVYKEAVLVSDDLSNIEWTYFGAPVLNDAKLKNWKDYIEKVYDEDEDEDED